MTFYCKNLEINTDQCQKLHGDCIMGRPGCVLEGRVAVSDVLQEKIDKLAADQRKRVQKRQTAEG
ncbi:MAG: hypothetical protein PF442_07370 [Desulfobulbaceae bacterium]|jgi:hypothetical protein|nr:hypothetical protein [Desulfobulbaceae bacterium]